MDYFSLSAPIQQRIAFVPEVEAVDLDLFLDLLRSHWLAVLVAVFSVF